MYSKVIYPDCWHSKGATANRQAQRLGRPVLVEGSGEDYAAALDVLFYEKGGLNLLLIQEALTRGGVMVAHLASMMSGFSISAKQVELRRSTFKATPLEGLCHDLVSSRTFQWESKSLYYAAILREIEERTIELEKNSLQLSDPNSS